MPQDILEKIPLFAKLSVEERAELAALLKPKEFASNQPVVWLGEAGDDFYIIDSGKVLVSCPDETGKEVTLGNFGPGMFFGEISLLDGGPRTANVRTLADAKMLTLSRADFLNFLRLHPDAGIYMLTVLGKRLRDTNDKIRGIRNVNEAVAEARTRWHAIAERVASISASQWFVLLNLVAFLGWVIVNVVLEHYSERWHMKPFDDPPSFGTLGFMVTIEALFISLFVLISQGQQGERDRIRADMDYQINLKAHQQVMQLHQKVDRLESAVKGAAAEKN